MTTRVEITKKYAAAYQAASKKDKTRILDQLNEVTGWNRDHARQQLHRRLRQPKGRASATVAVINRRKTRGRVDRTLRLSRVVARGLLGEARDVKRALSNHVGEEAEERLHGVLRVCE